MVDFATKPFRVFHNRRIGLRPSATRLKFIYLLLSYACDIDVLEMKKNMAK